MPGVFHHSRAKRFPLSLRGFAGRRQKHRLALRPNHPAGVFLSVARLSREFAPHPLLRCPGDKQLIFLTNNFALPATHHSATVQCRWQVELFFKWIKQHLRIKAFYGTLRERRQNPSLDCGLQLSAGRHRAQAARPAGKPVHNATNFKRVPVRENTHESSFFAQQLAFRWKRKL